MSEANHTCNFSASRLVQLLACVAIDDARRVTNNGIAPATLGATSEERIRGHTWALVVIDDDDDDGDGDEREREKRAPSTRRVAASGSLHTE